MAVASGPVEMVQDGLTGIAQLISCGTERPGHRPGTLWGQGKDLNWSWGVRVCVCVCVRSLLQA